MCNPGCSAYNKHVHVYTRTLIHVYTCIHIHIFIIHVYVYIIQDSESIFQLDECDQGMRNVIF